MSLQIMTKYDRSENTVYSADRGSGVGSRSDNLNNRPRTAAQHQLQTFDQIGRETDTEKLLLKYFLGFHLVVAAFSMATRSECGKIV